MARSSLRLLNSIKKEICLSIRPKKRSDDSSLRHLLDIYRQNQVTTKRYCRPVDHFKYFGDAYETYLRSTREQNELLLKYYSRKEKTVEESAKIVGLALPQCRPNSNV